MYKRQGERARGRQRKVTWVEEEEGEGEGKGARRLTRLPDSDLLKAVHAYASDFYGAMRMAAHESRKRPGRRRDNGGGGGYSRSSDFGSLDETALLAFGVLLEESVAAALGETGDMVFVEGEVADMVGDKEDGRSMSRSVTVDAGGEEEGGDEDGEEVAGMGKMSKKQRERMERLKRAREQDEGDDDDDGNSNRRSRKRTKRVHYEGDEDY